MKVWPSFPSLEPNGRSREFNYYSEKECSSVIYHWLRDGMKTRDMDKDILHLDPDKSNGYQSLNIYRYLGLSGKHQGFFKGWKESDVIAYFHQLSINPDYCVIFYYYLGYLDAQTLNEADIIKIEETQLNYPENDLKAQTWIRNSWIGNNRIKSIDSKLLSLPDITDGKEGKVLIKDRYERYSNITIKETIKDLYDFTCQICGEKILKTGWSDQLSRVDSWRYLSADVHHILPLSQEGPDRKDNMLCLCPTCHRKFHSGEFRLKEKNNHIFLQDELLGKIQELTLRHQVVLY